jgi:hypothetical protein
MAKGRYYGTAVLEPAGHGSPHATPLSEIVWCEYDGGCPANVCEECKKERDRDDRR